MPHCPCLRPCLWRRARRQVRCFTKASTWGRVGDADDQSSSVLAKLATERRRPLGFSLSRFWQPDVMTGKDGKATVKVTYPDSLTSWKATARAVTANQFGIADTNTHTKQPFIDGSKRRVFVVGDTVTISAVVNITLLTN